MKIIKAMIRIDLLITSILLSILKELICKTLIETTNLQIYQQMKISDNFNNNKNNRKSIISLLQQVISCLQDQDLGLQILIRLKILSFSKNSCRRKQTKNKIKQQIKKKKLRVFLNQFLLNLPCNLYSQLSKRHLRKKVKPTKSNLKKNNKESNGILNNLNN